MLVQLEDDIQTLLELSRRINSKTISLIRCLILALLSHFVGGLQYREMKAALKISDGKLVSNLDRLEEMRYIRKIETKLERRKLTVYLLTDEGKKEVDKITKWMKLAQRVAEIGDKECQAS